MVKEAAHSRKSGNSLLFFQLHRLFDKKSLIFGYQKVTSKLCLTSQTLKHQKTAILKKQKDKIQFINK